MVLPKKISMIRVRSAVLVHMAIIPAVLVVSLAVLVSSVWKVTHSLNVTSVFSNSGT